MGEYFITGHTYSVCHISEGLPLHAFLRENSAWDNRSSQSLFLRWWDGCIPHGNCSATSTADLRLSGSRASVPVYSDPFLRLMADMTDSLISFMPLTVG